MNYIFKQKRYSLLIPFFDILGAVIFFPFRIFKKDVPRNPKKILVVRMDHIGDFVCTTPMFKNLKKRFPAAKITALINSASKDLAYRDPNIDKVITFSPFYLARSDKSSPLKGLMRVVKDVRALGFDLGIDPRGDFLSIAIMWLGGVKYRAGYGITGGGFLLHKEGRYDRDTHVIDRNLALLKDLNVPIEDKSPSVYFNEKDKEAVEGLLRPSTKAQDEVPSEVEGLRSPLRGSLAMTEGERIVRNDKFVVLHPFAGAPAREWARDNFQNLINRLKGGNIQTFLIGADNDKSSYTGVIDMRGKFNLPQLAYFIKRIGFFIGLNSGPANIAAALGVPSVIISSGTNIIEHWIPNNPNVKFVYKDVECRPCENKVCPKEKHECMEAISVDDVMDAVKEIASPCT